MRENRTLRLMRRGLETGLWSDTAPVLDPTDERDVETEHGQDNEAPADERAGNG